ncbi:hypothetical protein EH244_17510 [Variovorax beijingensis]|uniref:HTH hxlR-type domain-containing protein n=1 Tax=Variovorax beijingensis TaxID=2496117 RepID=A0A3P3ELM2_9BURK|nr:winged helix-turn-helix transcriptional regulator [Variovorax beijingensis]RRH87294.1 hypothetical protein EH244_17510 [Variovorax beijingensis]
MVDDVEPRAIRLPAHDKRHGELVGCLTGSTPKVLTERLDGLEQRGLVSRELLPSFPRGVLYTLSARGRSLVLVLDRLEMWAKAGVAHDRTGAMG